MRNFTKLILAVFFLTAKFASGQDIPGYNTSNYAGVSGIDLNPSSIADMRYKLDFTLIGGGVSFSNSYVGIHSDKILDGTLTKYLQGKMDKKTDFKQEFLYENTSTSDKSLGINQYVQFPSVAVSINKNISIAFTMRERTMVNVDNMSYKLAHLIYTGLDQNDAKNLTYWGIKLDDDHFNVNEMSWMEYGLSYAQVIKGTGPHCFKIGLRGKLVEGIQAGYIYAQNLSYSWKNSETLSLFNSNFSYGQTKNLASLTSGAFNPIDFFSSVSASSVAFDIGATYEWRPDYADFVYDMDGEKGLDRRNKNKYKLKIGVSLLDLGSIKFEKGNSALDFYADKIDWNVKGTKLGKNIVLGLDSLIANTFPDHSKGLSYFTYALPTTFSVQIDYNLYKDLYLNFTSYTSPQFLDISSKVHGLSYYAITPRWDSKWFGVFLPISVDGNANLNMGAALRLGPVIIGTQSGLGMLFSKETYNADIHFALKIPIFQGRPPRDRDHDGVSDKYDNCPDKKGSWAHHGCPDADGDGVYDDVDKCPTVPGPVENNGCPWPDTDGDGVIDKLDSCPTIKGPKENHGCPWGDADKDGVLDNVDSCKFIPGPIANHGCPYGDADNDGITDNLDSCPHVAGPVANHGCPWGDADNDGIPDNLDSCPHTPGPVSNHGCPVLAKKTQEIVNTAFNNLEFELNSAIIKATSLNSIDDLAKLLNDHSKFKLKLSGYTDNVGAEDKNLKLSKDRAEAVRDALVAKGVDANKISVEYHGSANPIAPNNTEVGRAKNRRVEMKITFD